MKSDARDFANDTDPLLQQLRGALRRMAVTLTAKALWQLAGFRQQDGTTETRQVEPFTGIGFYSRPPISGSPEAIVAMAGGATTPVVIATRDEKTRAAVAGDLQPDETMVFTSKVGVRMTAAGTVDVRAAAAPATDAMIKGTTYRTAEDTLLTALSVFAAAISAYAAAIKAVADPSNAGTATIEAACTTMETAIAAFKGAGAAYLSTIGKVG